MLLGELNHQEIVKIRKSKDPSEIIKANGIVCTDRICQKKPDMFIEVQLLDGHEQHCAPMLDLLPLVLLAVVRRDGPSERESR